MRVTRTEKKSHFPENCRFSGSPRKKVKDVEKIEDDGERRKAYA